MANARLSLVAVGLLLALAGPAFGQQQFERPQSNGVAVDWCLNWGTDCGKPAADRFCADRGLGPASRFEIAAHVGRTVVLGTGQSCDHPNCDGFAVIECAERPGGESGPPARSAVATARIGRAAKPSAQRLGQLGRLIAFPSGASLWYWRGDIAMTAALAAQQMPNQSTDFHWSVAKVPFAQGAVWQVNRGPFPAFSGDGQAALHPPGLVLSGQTDQVSGSFKVAAADLKGRLPRGVAPTATGSDPIWHVRILPIAGGASPVVVGQPSNTILIYGEKLPASQGPDFKFAVEGQWYTKLGGRVRLTRFELVPYRWDDHWPSGCEVYKGAGYQKTPLEWAGDAAGGAFDWASEAYADIKRSVVAAVVTLLPFLPPEYAAFALDAALASAGIPPSLPNVDQLMNQGADYLAGQMVDEVAAQVPAGSALAQLGKEELRRQLRGELRQAVAENARQVRAALAARTKYCTTMEYPPYLKITIQNVGPEAGRDLRFDVMPSDDSVWLLRPGLGFVIDRIDAGESVTVPVDLFSHLNLEALAEDPQTSYSERNVGNWLRVFRDTPFTFTVAGGQTVQYRAMEEGGAWLESHSAGHRDGTGLSYTTPKRTWMTDPFVGP